MRAVRVYKNSQENTMTTPFLLDHRVDVLYPISEYSNSRLWLMSYTSPKLAILEVDLYCYIIRGILAEIKPGLHGQFLCDNFCDKCIR